MPSIAQNIGLRQYIAPELAKSVAEAETLDQLKSIMQTNLVLINKIRTFASREKMAELLAVIRDVGSRWHQILENDGRDILDSEDFARFQDFLRGLVDRSEQKAVISEVLNTFYELTKEQRNTIMGEEIEPYYPNAGVPIPNGLRLPSVMYTVDNQGRLWKRNAMFCRGGLLILNRSVSHTDGKITYEIAYQTEIGNQWRTVKVPFSALLDQKTFTKIVERGIQVNGGTLKATMEYLTILAQTNKDTIPTTFYHSKMGWIPGREGEAYIWGEHEITADGIVSASIPNENESGEIAKCYTGKGTLREWWENVFVLASENFENPYFIMLIATMMASPLLELVGRKTGWVLHLHGISSKGKTTQITSALSALGKVEKGRTFLGLDSNPAGIESHANLTQSIPLVLDDSAQKRSKFLPQIVYMVTNGQGKNRGGIDDETGIGKAKSWTTNTITAAEYRLSEEVQTSGADSRIFELTPSMFGKLFVKDDQTAKKMDRATSKYYGTLFPAVIQHIIKETQKNKNVWENALDEAEAIISDILNSHGISINGRDEGVYARTRQAMAIALLGLDAMFEALTEAGIMTGANDTQLNAILDTFYATAAKIVENAAPAGGGYTARLVGWIRNISAINQENFWKINFQYEQSVPNNGYVGMVEVEKGTGDIIYYWFPEKLEEIMAKYGKNMTTSSLIDAAREHHILIEKENRKTPKIRKSYNGKMVEVYGFRLQTSENNDNDE
jgi:hypothetical protein